MCLIVLTSIYMFCVMVKANNFPSLITTNATLAIVIDREYMADGYETIKESIETYLIYAKRELLKHGGVNIQYYSWTSINVKRDITAILSIASCTDTWRLFRAAEEESLLHMAISEADCPRLPPEKAITVPQISRGQEMPQLVLDLRTSNTYQWDSVVIIYDSTLNRDMITRVLQSLTRESINFEVRGATTSVFKLEPNITANDVRSNIEEVLSLISTTRVGRNFIAIVSFDLVDIMMDIAKKRKLVNTKNQWLYVISDTNYKTNNITRFRKFLKEGDNVAFVYNSTILSSTCMGGLTCYTEEILSYFTKALDDAIQEEFEIASQVSDEEWEAIRPTKLERRHFLLEKIKNYLVTSGKCENCTSWRMHTGETWGREYSQNISADSICELIPVGSWRPVDGISMADELFLHISHGFRKRELPVVTFHNPPWQILKTNTSGAVQEYSGLVFDIIKELANSLNFTYKVYVANIQFDQKIKLNIDKNNTSTIMEIADIVTYSIPNNIIDLVSNKTAAIGACAFTVTDENKHYINFTTPISTQSYTFLVARPRELSRALLFTSPFTGDTWLCLAAAIVSMGPILYYIHRYSPTYEYKGIKMKGGLSSIENCIWYMYGALLQQGGMHLPGADSARILVGAWWLVVLVVATTYCGNLVAFLTFPKIDIPITTIDELLAHRETVTWSLVKGSFLENQLKITPESKFKHIYDGKLNEPKSKQMIDKVENGKHVFIDWKIRLQYIMKMQYLDSDRCDLALGLDEFFDEQIALIVAHDTPYLTIINDEIKRLHQVGLIQKWLKDYLPKKDRCWKNRHIVEVNNHTVNMDDMQGSFFVLLFGFLLGVFIIFIEKFWHKYGRTKSQKVIQPFIS